VYLLLSMNFHGGNFILQKLNAIVIAKKQHKARLLWRCGGFTTGEHA